MVSTPLTVIVHRFHNRNADIFDYAVLAQVAGDYNATYYWLYDNFCKHSQKQSEISNTNGFKGFEQGFVKSE